MSILPGISPLPAIAAPRRLYFFPLRLKKGRASMKIIRKLCLGCMQGSSNFVTYCPSEKCNLYYFRLGKKGGF